MHVLVVYNCNGNLVLPNDDVVTETNLVGVYW